MNMQSKTIYIKWGGLLALAIFAIAYYFFSEPGTVKRSKLSFLIGDTSGIYEISFGYPENAFTFKKHNAGWTFDNYNSVNNQKVNTLLNALLRIDVKGPAPAKYKNDVLNQFKINGLKVSIKYNDSKNKLFYLCDDTIHNSGVYALSDNDEQAYLVTLPGYENRSVINFFVTDPDYWEDNILFNLNPLDINQIKLIHPNQKEKSFTIQKVNENYQLTNNSGKADKFNKEFLEFYLSNFQNIKYKLQSDTIPSTLLNASKPFAQLGLSIDNGKEMSLQFYEKISEETGMKDTYQLYAYSQNRNRYYLVDYYVVDPILKEYNYFLVNQ